MKGKKAFIKILEAGIASLLILGFIYFITIPTYVIKTSFEDEVYKSINSVLDEVERDKNLREEILSEVSEHNNPVYFFVRDKLAEKQLFVNISICKINQQCIPPNLPEKDIFVRERVIAGQYFKKISVYAWVEF